MVIYGWKNLLDRQALQRNPLAEIVRIYKETNERASSDPHVREACRQELVKLQAGDKINVDIWNECVAFSMQDFERIYKLLDVHYDMQCGESFYHDRLPGVVDRLLKAGLAEISEGAVVVFFRDDPELADKPLIIRKRDGGFNYATTDLATVEYRINELKARHALVRCRCAPDVALQADLRDRASRGIPSGTSPHPVWQRSRRRPQVDEDAVRRECTVAADA